MIPHSSAQFSSSPLLLSERSQNFDGHWRDGVGSDGLVLEAWSEGFMLGALVVMACLTVAVLRQGVLLHKLILFEQLIAMPHATFCFMTFNGYSWYVSSTAVLLYCSYILHNYVAWIKVEPFFVGKTYFFSRTFGKGTKWAYLITFCLTIPLWVTLMVYNFRFNNNIGDEFRKIRPYEPLLRDPWWLSTNIVLLHIIAKTYGVSVIRLIFRSPRLGILRLAICLSLSFTLMDILASILKDKLGTVEGINPYWKLSLVFKCLTDAIMLDDFKTELDRLGSVRCSVDNIQLTGTRVAGSTLVQYHSPLDTSPVTHRAGIENGSKPRERDPAYRLDEIENVEKPIEETK